MAESELKQQTDMVENDDRNNLKYLDFIQAAAIYVLVCFSTIYEYAKGNSGPLKPGVQTIEGTVRTVIGPVYDKFRDVPFELLKLVDRKVDDSLSELDRLVPSLVKRASSQARAVACEVQRTGMVDAAKSIVRTMYTKYGPMVRELYCKYEPVAEHYAVSAWRSLNRLPLFPQATQIAVPTAAYWFDKYNQVVGYTVDRGYTVAAYLLLMPIERIAKVFDETVDGPSLSANGKGFRAQ